MATKRKLSTRSYEEKYNIIKFVTENPTMMKKDVAANFNLKPNTLTDLLKNREKIIMVVENQLDVRTGDLKRWRCVSFDDVDAALLLWFRQRESMPGLHLTREALFLKAKHFAKEFGYDSFPSMYWVDRFKKRCGLVRWKAKVEKLVVVDWKDGGLKDVLERYSPADIYNAKETGLFWQMLPETRVSPGLPREGFRANNQSKSQITALVSANMDGSDKLPLFVIGRNEKPHAFRNICELPCEYEASEKALMTGVLFEHWLQRLDAKMASLSRKIAMVIDSCPAHPSVELENVELVFVPASATSVKQPMDAGIIHNLKLNYRFILASRRLAAAETNAPFEWDLLDAILALNTAWSKVTPSTIANSYRKVGIVAPTATADADIDVDDYKTVRKVGIVAPTATADADIDVDDYKTVRKVGIVAPTATADADIDVDDYKTVRKVGIVAPTATADANIDVDDYKTVREFRKIWEHLADRFDIAPSLEDYVSVDVSAQCREELTDKDIVTRIKTSLDPEAHIEDDSDGDEAGEDEGSTNPPNERDAFAPLDTIRR